MKAQSVELDIQHVKSAVPDVFLVMFGRQMETSEGPERLAEGIAAVVV